MDGETQSMVSNRALEVPMNSDLVMSNQMRTDDLEPETFDTTGTMGFYSSRVIPRKQYTKLETISGQGVRSMMYAHNVMLLLGVIYCLIIVILGVTAWVVPEDELNLGVLDYSYVKYPEGYEIFSGVLMILVFTYMFILTVFYWKRIITQWWRKKDVTLEMVWVMALTLGLTVYTNPFNAIVVIEEALEVLDPQEITPEQELIMSTVESVAFSVVTTWYIWTTAHSYRYLDRKPGILFYIPKILVVALGLVIRILAYQDDVYLNELALISIFRYCTFIPQDPRITQDSAPLCWALWLMFVELVGVLWTLFDVFWTRHCLKKVDYMRFRSKQIGFRFFVYFNATFYIFYWITMLVVITVTVDKRTLFFALAGGWWFRFSGRIYPFGMLLMLSSYTYVTATVNLPAHFHARLFFFGCKPCVRGSLEREEGLVDEIEPITYRSTEPQSFAGRRMDLPTSCFTMQTHVLMFNFAWLVYYYGTEKFNNLAIKQDVFKFEVADHVVARATDTHALVIDGEDRIVIAFRGTASGKNVWTDLKITQRPLREVIPSIGVAQVSTDLLASSAWRKANVHSGFASAYSAVAERVLEKVKELYDANPRPVYFTGHSLGGCLATLCSLDCYVSLGISSRDIFVSSFGSPRLGNKSFREVYDNSIASCWRIIVGPDMVAKLPRWGYKHCGKKVLLTTDGDLFLDPTALELKLWSGEKPGMLFHRKASYLLAMRTWCDINHGEEYVPEFWAWPFSPNDSRRFSHAVNTASSSASAAYAFRRSEQKQNRGTRLFQRDVMISQLNSGERSSKQLWASLSRRVLAEDRRSLVDIDKMTDL
ncbi:hypothetical protein NDN08_003850 [Rhodosorus marinus]|uniref:Fungal lipase-type domain-containing protein n=1 Tax=Rhodosorus marinus TaxID=101924 RepID=A0AAV8UKM7_9RHOD|nr:hypothetical protein NDN08_003850 [Rhodosorus marinus]